MNIEILKEMAETAGDLYDVAVKLNLETENPGIRSVSYEFRADLRWLKGKIEELVTEQQLSTTPTIGEPLDASTKDTCDNL